MPRVRFIGDPAQAIPGGPIWEVGESRDLSDEEAAPYLNNANWRLAEVNAAPSPAPPAPLPPPIPVPAPTDQPPQEG